MQQASGEVSITSDADIATELDPSGLLMCERGQLQRCEGKSQSRLYGEGTA